ncbi:MAG: oxygen-independent coproporphyrinogen III oxidase [Alphaproteobacteria bacterium CG_4_10_14_0_2_um_filter_63_37]|nr:MAG: oxygen-independent coproporphyrinogen III oxidase [Alphaproteobacteria bacterium CG_4_10_14_0_2_um_filter_63_37]
MSQNTIDQSVVFDLAIIHKYAGSGPRYTSYPTAPAFHEGYADKEFAATLTASNATGAPLSLYFHIPFCDTVCYYCGCNKVVTPDRKRVLPYMDHLFQEIERIGQLVDKNRPVRQLHWGGGTPTYLNDEQIRALMAKTGEHFQLLPGDEGEYGIEVDPREVGPETMRTLREVGFNRLSMGVQDFDPQVQKAVNRIQSEQITLEVMRTARELGFKSINIDLMYGLPHQTVESFTTTLKKVLELSPDRLAVFNYAHLPQYFMPQRRIVDADLPSPAVKLDILKRTIEILTEAGYVFIGMDHFAKPEDEMAVAQREGTMYRNFQGYTTHAECDLIGMGATSISQVGATYAQNLKELPDYYARLDEGRIPTFRGYELTEDDLIRRDVIMRLMCDFRLDFKAMADKHGIDFMAYFGSDLELLRDMENDGLLTITATGLQVNPIGRLLIRNVAMAFDAHLKATTAKKIFSQTV